MLTFSSLNESARVGGIKLQGDILERLAEYVEQMGVDFAIKAGIVHRKSVFQILTRILRLCPVDTGRLRGSWTPFMEAHGFSGFQQYMDSPGLSGSENPAGNFSGQAVAEGRSMGDFVDAYLNTSISSNVVYASSVNERQGFLTAGLIWGDGQYKRNFEKFLLATALKEAVTDPIPDDDAGQSGT